MAIRNISSLPNNAPAISEQSAPVKQNDQAINNGASVQLPKSFNAADLAARQAGQGQRARLTLSTTALRSQLNAALQTSQMAPASTVKSHSSLHDIVGNISDWWHHVTSHSSWSDTWSEFSGWLTHLPKSAPTDAEANSHGIANFAQVDPGFYRGHVPNGQDGFNWMRSQRGVGIEIDLRQPSESPQTGGWAQAAGIQHVNIPISDVGTPSGDQINQFFNVVDQARQQQLSDPNGAHNLFVHCKAGMNRTGTMVALTRIREGMTPDQAVREAESRGLFPITIQPATGNKAVDEINFVLKYGDAYQRFGIQAGSAQEQAFNRFFADYWNANKEMPRPSFDAAIASAWAAQRVS